MTDNNDNTFAEIMTNHVGYKVSYSQMKCIDCTLFLVLRALQDHQLSDFPNNTPLQSFWRGSSWNWFHSLKITQQKKYLMNKSWKTTMPIIFAGRNVENEYWPDSESFYIWLKSTFALLILCSSDSFSLSNKVS